MEVGISFAKIASIAKIVGHQLIDEFHIGYCAGREENMPILNHFVEEFIHVCEIIGSPRLK